MARRRRPRALQAPERTPAPIAVNWYAARTADQGVKQAAQDTRLAFAEKLDEGATQGFVEGTVALPLDAQWLLQLYVGGAAFDRGAPAAQAWPTQSTGSPDPSDSITMTFNGQRQTWTNAAETQGKKVVVTQVNAIQALELSDRSDFLGHTRVGNGILCAEVTCRAS